MASELELHTIYVEKCSINIKTLKKKTIWFNQLVYFERREILNRKI